MAGAGVSLTENNRQRGTPTNVFFLIATALESVLHKRQAVLLIAALTIATFFFAQCRKIYAFLFGLKWVEMIDG